MFWADKNVFEISGKFKEKIIADKPLVIRDEKTASGRVHVGSLRGVVIHGIISEILKEQGIKNAFLYEINDFDPMDGLPVYLDKEKYEKYMGQPLNTVPAPDNKAKNYAEYFGQEFSEVINELGFNPEYYRLSECYKKGQFNEAIKLTLENSGKIREIYKKVSGSDKPENWMPFNVICEKCGKIGTTQVISFDGNEVEYICRENMVTWARGCGHKGKVSPFNGNGKLPWKVEWAAKFMVFDVDIEGAGKDHSTKGGSRDIAETICKEVFKTEPPFNIPYEFVHVAGKKMSSSKGEGSSSREIANLLPPEILRLMLISKNPKQVIDFVPDGDTVPILYDIYDKWAQLYFSDIQDDFVRIFALSHPGIERRNIQKRFLPRFSQMAFLVQMPHMNLKNEIEKIKGATLTDLDIEEMEWRAKYAQFWLKTYAPEDYKYELQKQLPESAKNLTENQKNALKEIFNYIKTQEILDGQILHTKLHEIRKDLDIEPKELFSAIYFIFLGKDHGPKVGWFLSVLDKEFLIQRFEEVIK